MVDTEVSSIFVADVSNVCFGVIDRNTTELVVAVAVAVEVLLLLLLLFLFLLLLLLPLFDSYNTFVYTVNQEAKKRKRKDDAVCCHRLVSSRLPSSLSTFTLCQNKLLLPFILLGK
mmetsp:Transcript_4100/g.10108  ORF Transcript_4100/g.10108 Transcript_4100/m.10108 type:complete len:116 (+) Transcript_4100:215-562(+)